MTSTPPTWLAAAALVFACLIATSLRESSGCDGPGSLKARCAALIKEFDDRFEAARKALAAAKTEAEESAVHRPDRNDYAAKLLALAREDPADPGVMEALCWIIEQNVDLHRRKDGIAMGREVAELLVRHHLDADRLGRACIQALYWGSMPSPARDLLLPTVGV